MPTMARRRAFDARPVIAVALALAACSSRPELVPGDECELNTECDAPLVCRLGRCRVECRAQRDCAAGLECVRDAEGLGACQLREETECTLASDCIEPLVCRFGRCTNACEVDRDCPPGARCLAEPGGGMGCRDMADTECERNSDCPEPYICAVDERCREQCRTDRDCRDGNVCLDHMSPAVCGAPELRPDGGPSDGGLDRDGGVDPDAGDRDGSVDPDGGSGTVTPPPLPSLAAGFGHTCAAPTASDLRCFGDDSSGQIGEGTVGGTNATPHALSLTSVRVVGAGSGHSCAATTTELRCWGNNMSRQVGTGSTDDYHPSPTPIAGLPAAPDDLALGNAHTCALADDRVFCWGSNDEGQLGTAASGTPEPTPAEVPGLGGTPVEVATFGSHTCARLSSGHVECWGLNDRGQLGVGDTASRSGPQRVPGIDDAVQVATGSAHTCVLRATGALACWGENFNGELGDGTTDTPQSSPGPVVGVAGPVLEVALGSGHTCARTASDVWCWGNNFSGQVGVDDAIDTRFTTPQATGLGAVDEVRAGSLHTCVRTGSSLRCFGDDGRGQLGRGTPAPGGYDWMAEGVVWP